MSDNPAPLHLTISGYPVDIVKNVDGSVSITVHAGIFGNQTMTIPAPEWAQIVAYTSGGSATAPAAPLHLTISGYPVDITKNVDDSVAITIHVGIFGNQTITIPASEWAQIVAYTAAV